ncbi:MAG: hypothetical protein P0Y53_16320 [Candidatus Pseudobacter hemicellulosilyticus]|uniref:Uncharacterized protein n=1 Tax=Candidatus Pseudobacter hemicellulosilyticus TaxID=3121375 RepID=A0AAJ6BEI1_9BACT|nr:MAG: hypothetical protein P0Y53_16320 [Pseudobacter sp.]
MLLVVSCVSTGQALFENGPADACCSHLAQAEDDCQDDQQQSCANDNPFLFCSCCVHAWMPIGVLAFEPLICQEPAGFPIQYNDDLPEGLSIDFWQPPRFS